MSDISLYASKQNIPGPPFEQLVHPTLCDGSWDIFKKVYHVAPESFIVEVAINGAPRRDVGQRETNLPESIACQVLTVGNGCYSLDTRRRRWSEQ
jgi:hypothetical protein